MGKIINVTVKVMETGIQKYNDELLMNSRGIKRGYYWSYLFEDLYEIAEEYNNRQKMSPVISSVDNSRIGWVVSLHYESVATSNPEEDKAQLIAVLAIRKKYYDDIMSKDTEFSMALDFDLKHIKAHFKPIEDLDRKKITETGMQTICKIIEYAVNSCSQKHWHKYLEYKVQQNPDKFPTAIGIDEKVKNVKEDRKMKKFNMLTDAELNEIEEVLDQSVKDACNFYDFTKRMEFCIREYLMYNYNPETE